jgi:NAD(P)H-hydrate repair Nnr-like enzyme with NAD(P)H-hydrate dehydratase domain
LRAGAGKLQMAAAHDAALHLALNVPEARVMGLRCDSRGEIAQSSADVDACAKQADAIVVGPGMEVAPATRQLADHLMHVSRALFVLDAGGLDAALLGRLGRTRGPRGVIMTPHHGEMAQMLDLDVAEVSSRPLNLRGEFAQHSGVVLVLKATETYIATPDGETWVNREGSVGLGHFRLRRRAVRRDSRARRAWRDAGAGRGLGRVAACAGGRGAGKEDGPARYLAREIAAEIPALM